MGTEVIEECKCRCFWFWDSFSRIVEAKQNLRNDGRKRREREGEEKEHEE